LRVHDCDSKIPWCEPCNRVWAKLKRLKKGDLVECVWLDSCLFRHARHLTKSVYRTEKKTVGYFHSVKDEEYLILISEMTDGETYLEGNSLLIRGIIELNVRVPVTEAGRHVKLPKKHLRNLSLEPIKIIQTTEKVVIST